MNQPHEVLLNSEDVARILKISIRQAYRLMNGELKTVRFGRLVRVRPEDLQQFILEHLL